MEGKWLQLDVSEWTLFAPSIGDVTEDGVTASCQTPLPWKEREFRSHWVSIEHGFILITSIVSNDAHSTLPYVNTIRYCFGSLKVSLLNKHTPKWQWNPLNSPLYLILLSWQTYYSIREYFFLCVASTDKYIFSAAIQSDLSRKTLFTSVQSRRKFHSHVYYSDKKMDYVSAQRKRERVVRYEGKYIPSTALHLVIRCVL